MSLVELPATFETLIAFDVETTGLDCRRNRVIEFGAVCDSTVEEADVLIQLPVGERLPAEITQLTGIGDALLQQKGIPEAQAAQRIAALLSAPNTLLAAYNAQFDLCFLYWLLQRNGLEACLRRVKLLDALTVYRDRRSYPHRLSDAIAAYGIELENTHRALDDAKATLELLRRMQAERDDLERYVNLFGYHPKYGISGPRIASVTYRPQPFNSPRLLYETD